VTASVSETSVALRATIPPAEQLEALHASAVVAPAGLAVFCARSGTGKSTIASRLGIRGYDLWADDVLVWAADREGALAFRPARQRPDLSVSDADGASAVEAPRPVKVLVVLERASDSRQPAEFVTCRLHGTAALTAILPHAHPWPQDDRERQRDFLLRYVHLTATTPIVRLRFQPDPASIDALCDAVEVILADAGVAPPVPR
jgi:hypothetical protein